VSAALFDAAFLRRLEMLSLVSRKVFAGKTRGERRSTRRGGSVEFADYRQYAAGDDFRAIDWNAYARLEHLFLKLFVEEEDLAVHVLLDASASMAFGDEEPETPGARRAAGGAPPAKKLELGKRLAAAIAYCALAGYDRAGVWAIGGAAPPEPLTPLLRGKGRIRRIFDALTALAPREGAGSFNAAVRSFVERRPKSGVVVVISDLLDPAGIEEGVKRLRYGPFEPRVIHVLSPEELHPGVGGDHRLIDSEAAAAPVEVSLDARAVRLYQERLREWLGGIEGLCRQHGVGYARVSSDTAVEDVVLRALRAAQMVA
jgi:uncharacterized protein (DUF58 family)